MDATSPAPFLEFFSEDTRRTDWGRHEPHHMRACLAVLKQGVGVASVGVTFKLRLTFLVSWGGGGSTAEAWFVWHRDKVEDVGGMQAFFSSRSVVLGAQRGRTLKLIWHASVV